MSERPCKVIVHLAGSSVRLEVPVFVHHVEVFRFGLPCRYGSVEAESATVDTKPLLPAFDVSAIASCLEVINVSLVVLRRLCVRCDYNQAVGLERFLNLLDQLARFSPFPVSVAAHLVVSEHRSFLSFARLFVPCASIMNHLVWIVNRSNLKDSRTFAA